jgi:hypothetical protein
MPGLGACCLHHKESHVILSLMKAIAFLLLNIVQIATLVRSSARVVRRARFS